MKTFKKALALVLIVAVALTAGVMGTLAYLTSEDSDVNVMTMGFVSIKQHEYERALNEDGTYKTATIDNRTSYVLQSFTQGKPLLPIVGDPNEPGDSPAYAGWDETTVRMSQVHSYGGMQVFAGLNAQDKFVVVENDGITSAYVRTLVAIEIGSTDGSKIMTSSRSGSDTAPWVAKSCGTVTIDGNNYMLIEYTYRGASDVGRHVNGVLPAGETTYPSLCQVYLKHNATNEDCKAIDGNGNGTLDILVLSQAVQAAGFADAATALNTAFGDVATNAAAWFSTEELPVLVYTAAELQDALNNAEDGAVITLAADITGNVTATQKPDTKITIDGNGYTLTGSITVDGKSAAYETAGLTIENLHIVGADDGVCINLGVSGNNATRYTNHVTVRNCTFSGNGAVAVKSYTGGDKNLTLDGCVTLAGTHSLLQVTNVEDSLVIKNCEVNSKNGANLNNTADALIDGCTFNVLGYAVRFGTAGAPTAEAKNFVVTNCKLTSSLDDPTDAVIMFRGNATNAVLNLTGTTISGTTEISGNTADTTIIR